MKIKEKALCTIICSFLFFINVSANTAYTGIRNITSMQVVADMGAGINLTNTLDAYPNETSWGNPTTTLAMITALKQKGFKTLRLPVTWKDHLGGAPNYTIDPAWLARVETVANYAFANDMYVILNTHHEDWIQPTYANQATGTAKLVKVWTQIANRFKNYGDYLILETLNEPRAFGSPEEWTGGSAEHRAVVNAFNLAAVNAIRNTGGNNATRHLMIPTCGDNASSASMNALVIPNNDSRIIVTVHIYSPYEFCLAVPGVSTWGTAAEKAALTSEFDVVYNKFVTSGRAVVVGEWGAENKNNLSSLVTYADYFVNGCKSRKMGTINWMYVFDRNSLTWGQPAVIDAIVNPYKGGSGTRNITVRVRGTLGSEQIQLKAGSAVVSTFTLTTSLQNYTASTTAGGNLTVDFINDNGSRDVQLDYIIVNGITIQAESRATNTAVWQNNTCGGSNSEWLHCNGYIDFGSGTGARLESLSQEITTLTEEGFTIIASPNPATDQLSIRFTKEMKDVQVSLISISGKTLITDRINGYEQIIDISKLPAGVYLLNATTKTKRASLKILKK